MTGANATAQHPPPDRVAAVCCLAMLAAAFLWFWPTLQHGLRSDDYLTCYYVDRLTGAVHWGRVFEEFVRPWFGTGELYRPLISVSYGIELTLFPSPAGRHAFNVLFVAITAAATAATAALLAERARAVAACIAGAAVVLHPATVETAAWISARVTNLQMAACALACWAYARHLVRGAPLWPAVLLQVLALASKEGAATLVVSLLAIHCLHAPHAGVRARWRALVPFAVVLAAYLAWRLVVLGRIGPVKDGFEPANALNVAVRTTQLLAPPDTAGALPWWLLPLLLAAIAPLWRRVGALVLLIPAWFFLVLAPTQHLPGHFATLHGRFVFDAVPGLGIVLALAVAAAAPRAVMLACVACALGWLVLLGNAGRNWLERFGTEDGVARKVEHALATAAAPATPAQPFACTGLPVLPLFHDKLWGVLGLFPYAARDLAVIGLPELLVPDALAPQFFKDGAPAHAILAAGGQFAAIDYRTMEFVGVPRAPAPTLELLAANGELVVPPGLVWPGTALAAIQVRVPPATASVRLCLLDDLPDERTYGWQQQTARDGTAWFATAHAVAPMLLQAGGKPFRGIRLEVDGRAPPPGTGATVHAALAKRTLPQRAEGAPRARDEFHALSTSPPFRERSRLYVLLPTGARWMDVPPEGAEMIPVLREHLRWALDIFAPLTVHWFWQSPPEAPGRPWCSELDWAIAR